MCRRPSLVPFVIAVALLGGLAAETPADNGLSFERLAALRTVLDVDVSPDGEQIAYSLRVPRRPGHDDDGPAWAELHLVASGGGAARTYVGGEVNVRNARFTPDGRLITYLAKRDPDEHASLWAIPADGGESRRLLAHDDGVLTYRVSPDGSRIAFVGLEPEDERLEKLREKGYSEEVFEEDWRPRRLWIVPMPPLVEPIEDPDRAVAEKDDDEERPEPLPVDGSVFDVAWSPDGKRLALAVAPTALIDDRYMARRIRVVSAGSGEVLGRIDNPGKLGMFRFSPDGQRVAMISAADPNDPSEGRLMVADASGGIPRDLMPELEAHVDELAWKDATTLVFIADEGTETWLGQIDVRAGGSPRVLFRSGGPTSYPLLGSLAVSADGARIALVGDSPEHPAEVYVAAAAGAEPRRLTSSNPWLDGVELARQERVRWTAKDGLELEGILIYPLEDAEPSPAPLLLMVHGGPEAHDRNGWVTSYSRPGQLAAARGYAVLYPNYRGSTGRGVAFSKLGQGDAAGKEFDDLIDAVDAMVERGIADRDRVGITGGSYGGYATAWCSTRHTERFRAGVMFVGISNKVSKGLTTEIPVEDKMVHTLFDPWTRWQFSLERSPIFHAEKSRTALLIATGADDTRVHPSQSLQLYRALKLIGKAPVRLVRYPGEGHGNRRSAARDDYARRLMRWMDHFVKERGTELPPWEGERGASVDADTDTDTGADEDGEESDGATDRLPGQRKVAISSSAFRPMSGTTAEGSG